MSTAFNVKWRDSYLIKTYGASTLARMSFRLLSVYESGVSECPSECVFGWSMKIIFEHAQHIVVATEYRSVCIRPEPNSQYAPRTHPMLPEYDPFALRTPKFLFGKQTEWHSTQCDRAITLDFEG